VGLPGLRHRAAAATLLQEKALISVQAKRAAYAKAEGKKIEAEKVCREARVQNIEF
jgi:hypothetical protein